MNRCVLPYSPQDKMRAWKYGGKWNIKGPWLNWCIFGYDSLPDVVDAGIQQWELYALEERETA